MIIVNEMAGARLLALHAHCLHLPCCVWSIGCRRFTSGFWRLDSPYITMAAIWHRAPQLKECCSPAPCVRVVPNECPLRLMPDLHRGCIELGAGLHRQQQEVRKCTAISQPGDAVANGDLMQTLAVSSRVLSGARGRVSEGLIWWLHLHCYIPPPAYGRWWSVVGCCHLLVHMPSLAHQSAVGVRELPTLIIRAIQDLS
jgi:hypothetical protein